MARSAKYVDAAFGSPSLVEPSGIESSSKRRIYAAMLQISD